MLQCRRMARARMAGSASPCCMDRGCGRTGTDPYSGWLLSASGVMEACGGGFRYDEGFRRSAVAGEHGDPVIMATVDPVNLASLLDDAKCFALVRSTAGQRASVALDAAATRWS